MRVGITGHRDLDETTAARVDSEIRALLGESEQDIVGISCLADGADQIFARAVLDLGGRLVVVIPAVDHATTLSVSAIQMFEELKSKASRIMELEEAGPEADPYLDAGLEMLDRADRLIAVWDGGPPAGRGGTGGIVAYARSRDMVVQVVWPEGGVRTG